MIILWHSSSLSLQVLYYLAANYLSDLIFYHSDIRAPLLSLENGEHHPVLGALPLVHAQPGVHTFPLCICMTFSHI